MPSEQDPDGFAKWWTSGSNGLTHQPVMSDCRSAYKAGQDSQAARIAILKQLIADECEDDTAIRLLAKPFTDVDGDSYGVPCVVDIVEHLTQKLAAANATIEKLLGLCSEAWQDIFSTCRTNQANINGVELNSPDDEPCTSRIGTHFVHQAGVDESLRLVKRLQHAADAAEKSE